VGDSDVTAANRGEFSVWDCAVCCGQMVGGPRCWDHNPTPEERDIRNFWRRFAAAPALAIALVDELAERETTVSHPRSAEQPREEVYAF
jgi:hypothetical protein